MTKKKKVIEWEAPWVEMDAPHVSTFTQMVVLAKALKRVILFLERKAPPGFFTRTKIELDRHFGRER